MEISVSPESVLYLTTFFFLLVLYIKWRLLKKKEKKKKRKTLISSLTPTNNGLTFHGNTLFEIQSYVHQHIPSAGPLHTHSFTNTISLLKSKQPHSFSPLNLNQLRQTET